MNFKVFTYLASLSFVYIYSRLAIHYAPAILFYFLNSTIRINQSLEKPRVIFHLTGLCFMHLMYFFQQTHKDLDISLQILVYLAFSLGVFFCHISWGEKFKSSFSIKQRIKRAKPYINFNLNISDFQINLLYNEMVRYDLIDYEATSIQDFKNVLLKNWNSHNSKIHLKMDGPSCREFYDQLVKAFPNNSMNLKNLFITSGLIIRPDGRNYNYNTLKNAPTRSPVSKMSETLLSIFKRLE